MSQSRQFMMGLMLLLKMSIGRLLSISVGLVDW
jgi:hypothetical protein